MTSSPNALVLPAERASSSEAQTFPGFPGVYRPGVPVLLTTIGLDLMAARAAIADLGLPLVEGSLVGDEEPPILDSPVPRLEGDAPFDSGAGAPERPAEEELDEPAEKPLEQRTKADLVAYAAQLDPPLDLDESEKKDDLLAAIADHLAPPATTPPPDPPSEGGPGADGGDQ